VLIAALARPGAFIEEVDGHARTLTRTGFALSAAARTAIEGPRELARAARLLRRTRTVGATRVALPPLGRPIKSVLYLRSETTLHWHGAYVGGAATHTNGVLRGLVELDRQVRVLSPERPPGIDGIAFTPVPPRRLTHIVPWLSSVQHVEEYERAAAAAGPHDVVYQRYSLGSYAGLACAARIGAPLILEFNGSEIWTTKHWGKGELHFAETLAALERRNLEDASLLIVNSDVMADQLAEDGIDRSKVLVNPNGVDVDALAPARRRTPAEWRAVLGLPEAPTIGFVGTFGLWHGVLEIPEIVERVAARRPDIRWVLIGDGQLRGEMEADLGRRGLLHLVELPGIVPHDEAIQLLAASDAFISPHVPNPDGTRFFGSPTKLFEYMGLSRPIVASDLEQIGEILAHERTALLTEPGDAAAQADAVLRLIGDPDLGATLAKAALTEAEERHSWKAHVRRILDAAEHATP
jgi:glycosyltransferase involved in cell wall biosynthesis